MLTEWDRQDDHAEAHGEVDEADDDVEGDDFAGGAADTISRLLKVNLLAAESVQETSFDH